MPTGKKRRYLYEHPESPYWWYRFTIEKRSYRGSTGCVEAKAASDFAELKRLEKIRELQAQADAIGQVGSGSRQLTISQCFERFHRAKEPGWRSVACRRRSAEYCMSIAEGQNTLIGELTLADIVAFRARRKLMQTRSNEPVKDSTINRDVAHLRAAIRYAGKCGFAVPQIDWAEAIKTRAEKNRTRTLSEAEEARLFAAIDELHPDLEGPVRFAILSAARKSAVFGLRWDCVELEDRIAYIELKGEGDDPIIHPVPLTGAMVALIEAQPKVDKCPFVFTYECRRGDKRAGLEKGKRYPWTEHGVYKPWNAVVAKAGLRDFRFHDLRHTGATRLLRATDNLELTRQLLGHGDIKTTQKYANLVVDDVRAGMERAAKPRLSVVDGGKV